MPTIQNQVDELKTKIKQMSFAELSLKTDIILLDCREREEVELGVIPNSIWIPKGQVELTFENIYPDKTKSIVVYCASGFRSVLVAKNLLDLGFLNVASLSSGIQGWKDNGGPIRPFNNGNAINKRRYQAQLRVPEIGESGQNDLANAKVIIVGAGGIGSPVAFYLAAAGVGTIGLVDADVVDESNLQRQILHTTDRIGLAKVESAFLTLKQLNPHVKIAALRERLEPDNIDRIFSDYDIVVDGTDNFDSRYLINMACVKNKKIQVHGSVLRFQGQVSVFKPDQGPCYSCLFPEPPPSDMAIDCAQGGVLGAAVGVIGALMATETVKLILNKGRPLVSRMLAYDGLQGEFDELSFEKNIDCPVCSEKSKAMNYSDLKNYLTLCRTK